MPRRSSASSGFAPGSLKDCSVSVFGAPQKEHAGRTVARLQPHQIRGCKSAPDISFSTCSCSISSSTNDGIATFCAAPTMGQGTPSPCNLRYLLLCDNTRNLRVSNDKYSTLRKSTINCWMVTAMRRCQQRRHQWQQHNGNHSGQPAGKRLTLCHQP